MRNLGRERNCPVLYAAPFGGEFRRIILVRDGTSHCYQTEAWSAAKSGWLVRDRSANRSASEMVDTLFSLDDQGRRHDFIDRWTVLLEFRNCFENPEVLEDMISFLPDEDSLLALYFDSRRYNLQSSFFIQPVKVACAWVEGPSNSDTKQLGAVKMLQEKLGFVRNFDSVPKDDYKFDMVTQRPNL